MRRVDLGLLAILLVAVAVRVWGIDFGLPLTVCRPDENLVVQPALEYFGGDLDPRFYAYGTLGSYLLHAAMRVELAIEILSGKCADTGAFLRDALVDPGRWHLTARWISALAGVATVGLVHGIGRELKSRCAALCGAFFLAVCFLHARDSHFGTLDVLATLLTTAAVLCALRAAASGSLRALLGAAACAGLAAATKYGGALAAIAVLAAALAAPGQSLRARFSRLGLAGAVALAAFLLGMPYAAVHPAEILEAVRTESGHLSQGVGLDLGLGWWRHASFTLLHGVGWPLLAAAALGIWLLAREAPRRALVFLAFPLVFFAVAGSGRTVFARYMLPLAPILCALAALPVAELVERMSSRGRVRAAFFGVLAAALLAALPARSVLQLDVLLARRDTRSLARDWLLEHAAPGSSVAQTNNFARTQLPAAEDVRRRGLEAWSKLAQDRSDAARLARMRVPPLQRLDGPGYESRHWVEPRGEFVGDGGAARGDPDYVIVASSPLALFDPPVPPGLARALEQRFVLAQTIRASAEPLAADAYDAHDQFYLPLAALADVERPGPDLAIWARK